jgi:serine protease Do/serine protease DegQ
MWCVWCVGCAGVAPAPRPITAAAPISGRPTLAPMLDRVLPGVVNISAVSRVRMEQNPLFNDPFFRQFFGFPGAPRERQVQSLGSGVIVDADRGLIVTTNHVTKNAEQIAVTLLDGRQFEARVVASDPRWTCPSRGSRRETSPPCRSATPARCASATSSSRSAIRSGSVRRSRPAS